MASERGKGKGKGAQRSSSRNAGKSGEIFAPAVVPTSAAVLMLASVPPPPAPPAEHDAGALEASLTLASLSMPALAAGVLGPGEVVQLPGSPGTRADIPAAAESTADTCPNPNDFSSKEQHDRLRYHGSQHLILRIRSGDTTSPPRTFARTQVACAWRP
jgi:hypothetical protein